MRAAREVMIGERRVMVRAITVGEIRAWLKALEKTEGSIVDGALFADFTLDDLARMSDLSVAEMDDLTPSEIGTVRDACKEINFDFFALRARLVKLAEGTLMSAQSA